MKIPTVRSRRYAGTVLFVALALVTLIVFHRLALAPAGVLVGPQADGNNDLTSYFSTVREFQATAISRGEWPTWNPHGLGGMAHFGNPQSALLYPPNWLLLLFPGPVAVSWLMIAHILWGGWGVSRLARRRNWHPLAVLTAAAAFVGAPYVVAQAAEGHVNQICVASWLPWILLCYERMRERRAGGVSRLAIVMALAFFCGHVQELYYLSGLLTIWLSIDVLLSLRTAKHPEREPSPATAVQSFGWWLLAGLATAGLVAVELLPILQNSRESVRASGLTFETSLGMTWSWESFQQLWQPFVFGGPENYHGPGARYWESLCYVGVSVLLMSMACLIVGRRNADVRRWSLSVLGIGLFALGDSTPLYRWFFDYIPGGQLFRGPSRAMFLIAPLVALLAGFLTNFLLTRERSEDQLASEDAAPITPPGLIRIAMAILLLAVVVGELAIHARAVTRVIPQSRLRQQNPVVETLRDSVKQHRIVVEFSRLSDREAVANNLQKLQFYEPVTPMRTAILLQTLFRDVSERDLVGMEASSLSRFRPEWLDVAGVRFAVVLPGQMSAQPGWQLIDQGTMPRDVTLQSDPSLLSYEIWENTDALPRAFVLGEARVIDSQQPLVNQLTSTRPTDGVWLLRDVLPNSPRQAFRPAVITGYAPGRVEIDATLEAPGYLVLTDLYAAGWSATVGDQKLPILPAYGFFRAVPLPAGSHTVVMSYRPPGWPWLAVCSGLTLLLMIRYWSAGESAPAE